MVRSLVDAAVFLVTRSVHCNPQAPRQVSHSPDPLFGPCPLPYFSLCQKHLSLRCSRDSSTPFQPLPVPLSCPHHPKLTALTVVMAWDPPFLSQLLASSSLVQRKFTSLFATLSPTRTRLRKWWLLVSCLLFYYCRIHCWYFVAVVFNSFIYLTGERNTCIP